MRYFDRHCECLELYQPEHVYVFTGPCIATGKTYSVSVPAAELYAYRQGAYIQDALRSVSQDDREFLLSGISPAGWSQEFSALDQDEF